MKTFHLFFILFLISGSVTSQENNLGSFKAEGNASPALLPGMECPSNAVYTQTPLNEWSAWFCDANDTEQYTEVIDDYPLVSGNIKKITAWVGFYHRVFGNCIPGNPADDDYQVNFYQFDNLNPAYPGPLAQSFIIKPSFFQLVGSGFNDIYRIEFTLPSSVDLSPGWFGISRLNRDDNCILMWYIVFPGGNGIYGKQRHAGVLENTGAEYSFCLETESEPPAVPVSNWAFIFSGILIAIIVGTRHMRGRV